MARNTDASAAKKIGAAFRRFREDAGLTQRALAAGMRDAGFEQWDDQTVTNITTGIRQIALVEIGPLCALLNTTPQALLVDPLGQELPAPRKRGEDRVGEFDPESSPAYLQGRSEKIGPLPLWPGRTAAIKALAEQWGDRQATVFRRCVEKGLEHYGVTFPDSEQRMEKG